MRDAAIRNDGRENGNREKGKAYFAAIASNIVLAYAYVSGKILLESLTPLQILMGRHMFALIAVCLLSFREKLPFHGREEVYYALAGLGNILSLWLNYIALGYTTATNVGILGALVPFITGLLGYFFLKEKQLNRFFFSGCILAMLGVVLIYLTGMGFELHIIGDTIMLINGVVNSVYVVFLGKINQFGYPVIATGRRVTWYSLLFAVLFYFVTADSGDWSRLADKGVIWNLLLLGVGASALCLVGFIYSAKLLGVGRAGIFSYLCVIMSVIFSSTILGDVLSWRIVAATVLILTGTILSEQGENIVKKYRAKNNKNIHNS